MRGFCWTPFYASAQKLAAATVRDHLLEIVRRHRAALDETGKVSPACEAIGQNSAGSSEDMFGTESPSERMCRAHVGKIWHEAVIEEANRVLKSCYEIKSRSE